MQVSIFCTGSSKSVSLLHFFRRRFAPPTKLFSLRMNIKYSQRWALGDVKDFCNSGKKSSGVKIFKYTTATGHCKENLHFSKQLLKCIVHFTCNWPPQPQGRRCRPRWRCSRGTGQCSGTRLGMILLHTVIIYQAALYITDWTWLKKVLRADLAVIGRAARNM